LNTLKQFRSFDLAQREDGESLELERTDRRVVCLTFDTRRLCFAELCALLGEDELDEEGVRVFTERAHIAASIVHPRWAQLFDSGIDDGVFFYAREFVDGERLGDYVHRLGSVSNRLALDIILQLGEAIEGVKAYPELIGDVDLNDARIYCNRNGGLNLKMAGFPLESLPLDGALLGDSPIVRLKRMFERLQSPAMSTLLREMEGPDDLGDFLRRVKGIRARYPETFLEGKERPERVIEKEIFGRWRPREFLSKEFSLIADSENPHSPYTEAVEGPNGRRLRLHVLPPVRMLRDDFLTFYKSGIHPAAIAVHAEWKNEDFRLIAEEMLAGASLAKILKKDEVLNPAETHLLVSRMDEVINDLEDSGIIVQDFQPENVFLCLDKESGETIEEVMLRRPLTDWPEFKVRIRTHLTMTGIVFPPDAELSKLSGNGVFTYLALRSQGLREKVRQLVAEVAEDAENFMPEVEIEQEEEYEVFRTPLRVAADEPIEEEWAADFIESDQDEIIDDDEPEEEWEEVAAAQGFNAWVDWDEMAADGSLDDVEDFEDELAQPVLSPVAAAMGVDDDEAFHYDFGDVGAVEYPVMQWRSRGFGSFFWMLVLLALTLGAMAYLHFTGRALAF
jgi:hypothetical protein